MSCTATFSLEPVAYNAKSTSLIGGTLLQATAMLIIVLRLSPGHQMRSLAAFSMHVRCDRVRELGPLRASSPISFERLSSSET